MKDYFSCLSGEWRRYIQRRSIVAWLFILALMLYQANTAIKDTELIPEKAKVFKVLQQKYFNNIGNYIIYKAKGFEILFIQPSAGIIFQRSANSATLTSQIDFLTKLKISSNAKGKEFVSRAISLNLDISGIIKWLYPLLALWYGLSSIHKKDFLHSLSSIWSRVRCYLNIVLARLQLFITFFLATMGIVILFILARGVNFTPGDWSITFKFLLWTILYLMIFFGVGVFIGFWGSRVITYVILLISWFVIIMGGDFILTNTVEPNYSVALEDYRTELEKFSEFVDFQNRTQKERGNFDRKKLEEAQLVIEDFWRNNYLKIIVPEERKLRNMTASDIEKERNLAKFFPGSFFNQMANEVSGRGYNNYLLFYDYTLEMQPKFVRFIIDRTYYNDPKVMVNFIKGDEDIFIGKSSVPQNYWTADLIHLGYFVIFLIAGYFCFEAKMFPKPGDAKEFDNVEAQFQNGENALLRDETLREEFSQQLLNVFFGKCRNLKAKITMDGKSLLTGKKHDFIYIPKPSHIPDEWKNKHLIQFFKRLLHLDPKDLEKLYIEKPGETRKKWLNKFYQKMDPYEKADLLLSLFLLAKRRVYICNNFADDIPGSISYKLNPGEKQPADSMIISISRIATPWLSSKLTQRFYYKKGEGYFFASPIKNEEH